jgi:hypothetical protein
MIVVLLGYSGWAQPPLPVVNCNSIHAVRIAQENGLSSCTSPLDSNTGLFDQGCSGLLTGANGCADEHYNNPELYVDSGGNGSYDLYYLPELNTLRCADGTKPHFYYDPAGSNSSNADKWIIYHNGSSGKCSPKLDRTGVSTPAGPGCFHYFADGGGNSGYHQGEHWSGKGILSDHEDNGLFRDWNRVWIPSCSNDQYQGTIPGSHPPQSVSDEGGIDWHAPLWSQGHDIFEAVIDELALSQGMTDANLVVLYGSSGGADARSEPNLSGAEGIFDDNPGCESIYDAGCLDFDWPPVGVENAGFSFDTTAYQPTTSCLGCGTARHETDWWGGAVDASCLAYHSADTRYCYDGYHVMYHHIGTPVFLSASLRDKNQYDGSIEYVDLLGGDNVTFQSLETSNCGELPRRRVIAQLRAYRQYRDDLVQGAHGEANGAGPIGVWAIDWSDHEITKDDCTFLDAELDYTSLDRAFYDWAVYEDEIFLVEHPQGALRTASPVYPCVEKTLSCGP